MCNKKVNSYTLTVSGTRIDLELPTPEMFNIDDISHALGNVNRFNGNLPIPYSVAQHSVMVSHLVPEEHALAALLHDASESVLCDIPTPVKQILPHSLNVCDRIVEAFEACSLSPEVKASMLTLLSDASVRKVLARALPGYADLEARIQGTIHEAFGLPRELHAEAVAYIKQADARALATEKRDLFWVDDGEWPNLVGVVPAKKRIVPFSGAAATDLFRRRYNEIMQARALQAA